MKCILTVASTRVCPRTRSAFSPQCVDDLQEQLAKQTYLVNYEWRHNSLIGRTFLGTQRLIDGFLEVEAELAPPFYSPDKWDELVASGTLGAGCAGAVLRRCVLDGIEVIERISLEEIAVLAIHSSVDYERPIRKCP